MIKVQKINIIVAEVMSQVLRISVFPDDAIAMNACTEWDSLKHIELIMTLEERFGIFFEPDSLPELRSQDIFVEHIRRLLHHA